MKNKRSFLSLISVILLLTIASCSRNGLSSSANKNIKREKAPIEKYLKENLPKCDFKKEIVKKDKYSSYVRYIYELEGESKTKEIDPKIVDGAVQEVIQNFTKDSLFLSECDFFQFFEYCFFYLGFHQSCKLLEIISEHQ